MIEDGRHDLAEGVTQHLASIRHASSEARQARCEKANVTPITVHATRRTCATLLADLDVHPRVAMQVLRHARFSVTMEYLHAGVDQGDQRRPRTPRRITNAIAVLLLHDSRKATSRTREAASDLRN